MNPDHLAATLQRCASMLVAPHLPDDRQFVLHHARTFADYVGVETRQAALLAGGKKTLEVFGLAGLTEADSVAFPLNKKSPSPDQAVQNAYWMALRLPKSIAPVTFRLAGFIAGSVK